MAARSYLALDLGAESGRAALGQFDGERLVCAEVHRFANQPVVAEVAVLAQPATAWIEPDAAELLHPDDVWVVLRQACLAGGQTPPQDVGGLVRMSRFRTGCGRRIRPAARRSGRFRGLLSRGRMCSRGALV